jgi:hypothetical protein
MGAPLTTRDKAQHQARQSEAMRQDKEAVADRAKAAGMRKRSMRDSTGTVVEVWSFASSYHAMGFDAFQIAAAENFGRDWEAAYRGLKGQGYEPSVDGARSMHGPHLSMVQAQNRLQGIRAHLGARSWEIVVAVVIHGATSREIHRMGGADHRTVKNDMNTAFNSLYGFYAQDQRKDRTWTAFERLNAERAAMIAEAERKSV